MDKILDFRYESESGAEHTLRADVDITIEDIGIGSYECHGRCGNDVDYDVEIDDVILYMVQGNRTRQIDFDKLKCKDDMLEYLYELLSDEVMA